MGKNDTAFFLVFVTLISFVSGDVLAVGSRDDVCPSGTWFCGYGGNTTPGLYTCCPSTATSCDPDALLCYEPSAKQIRGREILHKGN